MYPKLGAIPTPTAEEGEAGEADKIQNEYADEGQEQFSKICKKWQPSCSMRAISIIIILTVTTIAAGGFLYHHLTDAAPGESQGRVTKFAVPSPDEVMYDLSSN